jgi:fatty acid desaturase
MFLVRLFVFLAFLLLLNVIVVIVVIVIVIVIVVIVFFVIVFIVFRHNFWSREFDSSQRCRAIDSNNWCSAEPRN